MPPGVQRASVTRITRETRNPPRNQSAVGRVGLERQVDGHGILDEVQQILQVGLETGSRSCCPIWTPFSEDPDCQQ